MHLISFVFFVFTEDKTCWILVKNDNNTDNTSYLGGPATADENIVFLLGRHLIYKMYLTSIDPYFIL